MEVKIMKKFKKISKFISVGVTVAIMSSSSVNAAVSDTGFDDVSQNAWYASSVQYITETGIMRRTDVTKFSPDEALSRELFSMVLFRMSGSDVVETNIEFDDVMQGRWYRNGALWAAKNGILNGYGNNVFGAGDSITREQFISALWRYAGSPMPNGSALNYTDADSISDWAKTAAAWGNENNLIHNKTDGTFSPKEAVTRAEAANTIAVGIKDSKVFPESKAEVIISEVEEAPYIERVKFKIDGTDNEAVVKLIDSKPAREFIAQLPMTVEFSDFGEREKFASMPKMLTETEAVFSGYDVGEFLYGTPYKCMIAFYKQDGEVIDGLIKLGDFESGIEHFSVPQNITVTIEAME